MTLLALTSEGHAQGILLYQSADCGQWALARKVNKAGFYEQHLTGYVNGLALGSGIDLWVGARGNEVSREQLFLWIDKWCQNNPLETVSAGAYVFADEQTKGVFKNRYLPK